MEKKGKKEDKKKYFFYLNKREFWSLAVHT